MTRLVMTSVLFVLIPIFLLFACGGGTQPSPDPGHITSVTVATNKSNIVIGDSFTTTASVACSVVNGCQSAGGPTWSPTPQSATGMTATFQPSAAGDVSITATLAGVTSLPVKVTVALPIPSVASISPNAATRGDVAFILTVNGSNFFSTSTVQWNGNARTTSFVSPTQLTAQITAEDIVVAQPYNVTVVNPSPGGGTSAPVPFSVPCVFAPPTAASSQTAARLGAYYFDGWAGPLDSYHLKLLVNSPYQYLQPLSGWRDDNPCAVEQQLAWAKSFGLNFFVFDWYYNAKQISTTENLNSALEITHSLSNRHGMQFAIMYTDHGPFVVTPSEWNSAINEWISYMTDPDYVRVNGKPLLILYDMGAMRQAFESSAAVASAFDRLRKAAQAQGLPGVYIVGGFLAGYDPSSHAGAFPNLSIAATDGYDAVGMYNWSVGNVTGEQPFSILVDSGQWVWSQTALNSPVPFIPVAMDGWDARPNGPESLVWFSRSPQDVSGFVSSAITWAEANPQLRPEPSPAPPLVLIEAWNELLEGSCIVPSIGDGTSYGDSLAAMLAAWTGNAPPQAAATPPRLPTRSVNKQR